jgi:hypothetical protein
MLFKPNLCVLSVEGPRVSTEPQWPLYITARVPLLMHSHTPLYVCSFLFFVQGTTPSPRPAAPPRVPRPCRTTEGGVHIGRRLLARRPRPAPLKHGGEEGRGRGWEGMGMLEAG